MILDIVIPTYNEEENLSTLLPQLNQANTKNKVNIIVIDAASSNDQTENICIDNGIKYHRCDCTQRSTQMNTGAEEMNGDILLFLHADVTPPQDFYQLIIKAISEGSDAGCFAYKFKSEKFMLKINSYFTRFNGFFTGGGDQAQYITRKAFLDVGRFSENHIIMEDYDLLNRIKKKKFKFTVIKSQLEVSARKYEHNSWLKVNLINLAALLQYKVNRDPYKIKTFYDRWLE